ncbi:hypothetical protein AB0H88_18410 [Nonomuraea sp. NPDC050680]|uniref:hypothetical protein n=1 Tax=Nonomuraea sp. NPDC050680 TaxID=3154630 RepID=UPI0033D0D9AA
MERDGLIVGSIDPDDRRRSRNTLTCAPVKSRRPCPRAPERRTRGRLEGIGQEEIEAFMRTLARMNADHEDGDQ